MQIILLANQKGGSGKTTVAALLALAWAEQGKSVLMRDLDTQGSTEAFVEHIEHKRIQLYSEGAEGDFLLVDTPGGIIDTDLKNLVYMADRVIIPFVLSATDMRATGETVRRIVASKKARLLYNRVNTQTTAYKDRRNYADLIGIKALKHHLADRTAYKYALVDGWSAITSKAREELIALATEIRRK
jgi:chromosome partitioning protein